MFDIRLPMDFWLNVTNIALGALVFGYLLFFVFVGLREAMAMRNGSPFEEKDRTIH